MSSTISPAVRAAFEAEAALIAAPWAIAGQTYAPADVWAAVDPDGYAVALADFAAEHAAR